MLDSQINLYQEPEILPAKKCKAEVEVFTRNAETVPPPPPPPQQQPPKNDCENGIKNEKTEENKETVDDAQTLQDSGNNFEQAETFLPVFQETVVVQNPFDKDDDLKLKKVRALASLFFLNFNYV